MPKFVSVPGTRIVAKGGVHLVDMPAMTPVEIPQFLVQDAYAHGCVPAEMLNGVKTEAPAVEVAPAPAPAELPDVDDSAEDEVVDVRQRELNDVFVALMAANKRTDFTPNGVPRVGAVRDKLKEGDPITTDEVREAWSKFQGA